MAVAEIVNSLCILVSNWCTWKFQKVKWPRQHWIFWPQLESVQEWLWLASSTLCGTFVHGLRENRWVKSYFDHHDGLINIMMTMMMITMMMIRMMLISGVASPGRPQSWGASQAHWFHVISDSDLQDFDEIHYNEIVYGWEHNLWECGVHSIFMKPILWNG